MDGLNDKDKTSADVKYVATSITQPNNVDDRNISAATAAAAQGTFRMFARQKTRKWCGYAQNRTRYIQRTLRTTNVCA